MSSDKKIVSYPPDSSERDIRWYKQWLDFFLYQYRGYYCPVGPTGILSGSGASIPELRAYAAGRQSSERYQSFLDPKEDRPKSGSFFSSTWDNHMILTKSLDICRERILMIPLETMTEAMDNDSDLARNKKVGEMKAMVSPLGQMMPEKVKLPKGINTASDVDDYLSLGLVVLEEEARAKDVVDNAYRASSSYLESMVIDDLTEVGIAAKEVCCGKDGKPYFKWVNPARLIMPASEMPDCRDIWYVGVTETIPISQLRNISDLTETDLLEAAKKSNTDFASKWGNYAAGYDDGFYESITCDIIRMYWVARDAEDWMVGIYKPNGTPIFKKAPADYEERPYSDTRIQRYSEDYVYSASMVIATGKVFGAKKMEGQVRLDGTVKLPIVVHKMNKPAIVERCKSLIDDIQLEINSLRNTIAKLPPFPRLFIDESLLKIATDVTQSGNQMTKNVREFFKTGMLRGRSKNELGNTNAGSNRSPIEPLEMNVSDELITRMNRIAVLKEEIKDVSGINAAIDGSIKNQDMLVGTMDKMEASATMVLATYVRARKDLKERSEQYALAKYQMAERNGASIGNYRQQVVGRKFADMKFTMQIVAGVTKAEVDMLMNSLMQNRQNALLNEADYFIIYNMMKQGDIKKAQFYMSKAVANAKEEAKQQQMAAIEAQGKVNEQNAQATQSAMASISTMKLESEKFLRVLDGKLDIARDAFLERGKMERLLVEQKNPASLQDKQ